MQEHLDVKRGDLGMKLVDKCEGLPLAIKALGIYLNSYESRQDWEGVLNSQVWSPKTDEVDVLPSLWFMILHYSSQITNTSS